MVSGPPAHAARLLAPFLQKEEYHTHLAVLYLDEVLQQRPCTPDKDAEVTETQAKLRRLLQESDLYRVHFLMGEWTHVASVDKCHRVEGDEGAVHEPPWHQVSLREARGAYCLSSAHGQGPLANDPEAAQGAGNLRSPGVSPAGRRVLSGTKK